MKTFPFDTPKTKAGARSLRETGARLVEETFPEKGAVIETQIVNFREVYCISSRTDPKNGEVKTASVVRFLSKVAEVHGEEEKPEYQSMPPRMLDMLSPERIGYKTMLHSRKAQQWRQACSERYQERREKTSQALQDAARRKRKERRKDAK